MNYPHAPEHGLSVVKSYMFPINQSEHPSKLQILHTVFHHYLTIQTLIFFPSNFLKIC